MVLSVEVPLTAEIHRDGEWFVAFCPEVPEANGQGHTQEECLASLREAVLLLMEDRREDARNRLLTNEDFNGGEGAARLLPGPL